MQNININDINSNKAIDIVLDESNFNKLKVIGKAINSKKEEYNPEEIILASKKKANIYKELFFINQVQLDLFKDIFEFNDDSVQYKVIKNKDILIITNDKKSLNIILIGDLDKKTNIFKTKNLIEYKDNNLLNGHLSLIANMGIDEYFNNYISFKDFGNCCSINHYNDKPGWAYKYDENIKDYSVLPYISINFDSCPNIGLRNIGATCYMNSTLQCLCHIDKFVEYFKYNFKLNNRKKDKFPLTLAFKEVIENLWPNKKDPSIKDYPPKEFKETISKMNPLFEGIAANDAKDLVNFIIMTLDLELDDDSNNQFVQYSQANNNTQEYMRTKFLQDFKQNTIVTKLFYGINYNASKCTKCSKEFYNYQTFFFLIFPLEEVRKFKYPETPQVVQPIQNNLMNSSVNMNMNMSLNISKSYSQPITMSQQPFYNQYGFNQQGFMNGDMMGMNNYNQYVVPQQAAYPNNFNQYPMSMNMPNQLNNNMMAYPNVGNNFTMPVQMQAQLQPQPQPQQQPQQNNINKNQVSIEDCFEYYLKENTMEGENSMYCQKCNSNQTFTMSTKIERFPEVLIIILNRGMGLQFDVKIDFLKMVNLGKFIGDKKDGIDNTTQYDLIGVISHLGESSDAGHFFAYCLDPIKKKKWFKYNDSIVAEVEDFEKEVVDFGMPYVLFYQKH